jgi:hypothetical protein
MGIAFIKIGGGGHVQCAGSQLEKKIDLGMDIIVGPGWIRE